ncbi:MAG TPA: hypothetical protein V6C71_02785 [Coleofasciculaceae cyanobacterium]
MCSIQPKSAAMLIIELIKRSPIWGKSATHNELLLRVNELFDRLNLHHD